MSIFSSRNEKDGVHLIIDVGSSTVTCALVELGADLPVFLYSTTGAYNVNDKVDVSRLVTSLTSLLDSQLDKLVKEGFTGKQWSGKNKKIVQCLMSFSSPWFSLKTKHLALSNEKDFIISESFLEDVISKEIHTFKLELSPNSPDSFEIVEKNVLHTKIKGYEIKNIINKKTNSLEAYLCMSAMDSGLVKNIIDVVSRHTHISKERLKLHTFPIVSFSVIRDFFDAGGDFLILDISGDVTDITLVQDYVIKQTVSVPSGRNFILRQIAKNSDVSIEIAESMLHMFNQNQSDESVDQKMNDTLTSVEREWAIYIENALSELSPTLALPANMYLMSDSDVSHIYTEFMTIQKTDITSSFRKSINITVIDEVALAKFYKNEGSGKVNEFIAFVSLFSKKLLNNK